MRRDQRCGRNAFTIRSAEKHSRAARALLVGHIALTAVVFAALGCSGDAARAEEQRPNFLVIMADDLGAKELGCYDHPEHQTPRLDRLARTGVQFETCYATPICHSTRFEIMTGQYGCHNGVYNFSGRRGGPAPDSPVENIGDNHVTFAEILQSSGYATVLAGKWQLSGTVPNLIHECGFDEYMMWAYKHNLPSGVKHTGGWEKKDVKTARYWHPSIVSNGKYVPTEPDSYGPDLFTDFLIDFIRRHRDGPFLAYFPMCLTHNPWLSTPATSQDAADRTKGTKRNFRANVEYTDRIVGRLIDALDELGLRERTVVMFTGDNGTGRDGKGEPTELGARVPMIVNAPGIVKPQGACRELIDFSDILPTLVDMAGAQLPSDRTIDGHSFAHLLRGEPGESREWIFSYIGDRRIVRDARWLLEDNSPRQKGRFFDCGLRRDGKGYQEVTDSSDPTVIAARARFEKVLANLPAPEIAYDGPPAGRKRSRKDKSRRASDEAGK